ncbi:Acetyl esterase/lipase [Microbacterium sp. cf046]|uniref:alpha/beta hydrolase n=1 Tax=Microbacterium sp. cf046 TaxID=1761803 RepID=UPI0008E8BEF1|nr:alpha/beta hydrolase [Microbacterium sp. cf046]SFR93647.1 Acetyl esterase/lipase [Microbacterium sp. cf046]
MPIPVGPPFDPELEGVLAALADKVPPTITAPMIEGFRAIPADPSVGGLIEQVGAVRDERTIAGYAGADVAVSVIRGPQRTPGPAIVYLHGGGMIFGNRFGGVGAYLPFIQSHGVVVVTVEYRLAPEHPDPVPVEDCFAAVQWVAKNAAELGVDPARLIVAGQSAGAGLAAGVALLARDRGGPAIAAQVLVSPMLDDRNDTVSAHQIDGIGVWDRSSNDTGWTALLGARRGGDDVAASAAPGRVEDLAGLPPAFISVGSAEVFRDEAVSYASRIWACGGVAELHVWPGGFHGFENFAPDARISRAAAAARDGWLARTLGD